MEQDREGGREGGTEEKEDPRRREAASKSRAAGWSPVTGEEKKTEEDVAGLLSAFSIW